MPGKNESMIVGVVEQIDNYYKNKYGQFYKIVVSVPRNSGTVEEVVVVVPEKLIKRHDLHQGKRCLFSGNIRSTRIKGETHNDLFVFFYAKSILSLQEEALDTHNELFVDGVVVHQPHFRFTQKNEPICTFLMVHNDSKGKPSYIPVVCWHDLASLSASYQVGQTVSLEGRLQSRRYIQLNGERKTIYEIVADSIKVA